MVPERRRRRNLHLDNDWRYPGVALSEGRTLDRASRVRRQKLKVRDAIPQEPYASVAVVNPVLYTLAFSLRPSLSGPDPVVGPRGGIRPSAGRVTSRRTQRGSLSELGTSPKRRAWSASSPWRRRRPWGLAVLVGAGS